MKSIVATILIIFSLSVFTAVIVKSVQLNQNCTGHLKRAADANSVKLANQELSEAIAYLETNDLTHGYTSILWKTPDEDIGFFYDNLKQSQLELQKVTDSTTSLEKSNMLMKLRETLVDNGKEGSELTCPDGLSRYPHNLFWSLLMWLASVSVVGLIAWFFIEIDDKL